MLTRRAVITSLPKEDEMIRALVLLTSLARLSTVTAQEKKAPPGPPKPGAEMKALQPLVGAYTFSDGKVAANAMGPGSPETKSKGKHTCKPLLGGLWLACDIEDTAGEGKAAHTWSAHMMMGWDIEAKQYKSLGVDNMGSAWVMTGKVDANKVVWESGEMTMMGQPVKFRITIDWTDPKALKLTDERSTRGGAWMMAESATLKR
jgi:hypothetical protein